MKKQLLNTGGINCTVQFKAEKKSYSAPVILSEFINEDNELTYELDNGNTITASNYKKMWLPTKKEIMPANYKGENPDKTLIP